MFGGIVNCATIAKGIVNATKNLNLTVPLTVRLEGNVLHVFGFEFVTQSSIVHVTYFNLCWANTHFNYVGTNVTEGRQLLENSMLGIKFAENLDQAAQKATENLMKNQTR